MDFTLYNQLSKAWQLIGDGLNWIAPASCIQCNTPLTSHRVHPCCDICYPSLPFQANACAQCAEPYAGFTDVCGRCLTAPPSYNACFCPFEYAKPISDMIIRFKYHETPELAGSLAKLLVHEIKQIDLPQPELLLPVPMHIKRLRQRGYNQSSLLAAQIGKMLDIPVSYSSLCKAKVTDPQAQQTLKQRKNNVLGSFTLQKKISAKSIAIVDDVVTTGSTAAEIAKILKKNGVDYVQVWGIARTL